MIKAIFQSNVDRFMGQKTIEFPEGSRPTVGDRIDFRELEWEIYTVTLVHKDGAFQHFLCECNVPKHFAMTSNGCFPDYIVKKYLQ